MKFSQVAEQFENIEKESSRTGITELLGSLMKECSADEIQKISYLSMGSLFPPYKTVQLNIAKKGIVPIIAGLTDLPENEIQEQYKLLGDVGLAVQYFWKGEDSGLSVAEIYDALVACAQISGTGSTEKKSDYLIDLLQQCDALSAKFIVRIVTKTLRLGFSDMTFLDALSWMETGNKLLRADLEHAYNVCADLGLVAYNLKDGGIGKIKSMEIQVGIPVRPAAAERMNSAEDIVAKLGSCVAQPKLDGFRIQLHIDNRGTEPVINFYSRNLLDMSEMFPDLKKIVSQLPVATFICEGEAIGYDEQTGIFLPFQETVKRKRKHGVKEMSDELPLSLYLFDLLFLNGESLLNTTHKERRRLLSAIVPEKKYQNLYVIEEKQITQANQLESYFFENIQSGLEGLVVKREDAIYKPGKRNFNWIKLKRQANKGTLNDTIDCVILGYYTGEGRRASLGIGAFLVGVYNKKEDKIQTIAKVGTGVKDHEWKILKQKCDAIMITEKLKRVQIAKDLIPDVWVQAEIICTIQADEITMSPVHTAGKTESQLGYALRFPRFIDYRIDKSLEDTTSVDELKTMFEGQKS